MNVIGYKIKYKQLWTFLTADNSVDDEHLAEQSLWHCMPSEIKLSHKCDFWSRFLESQAGNDAIVTDFFDTFTALTLGQTLLVSLPPNSSVYKATLLLSELTWIFHPTLNLISWVSWTTWTVPCLNTREMFLQALFMSCAMLRDLSLNPFLPFNTCSLCLADCSTYLYRLSCVYLVVWVPVVLWVVMLVSVSSSVISVVLRL